MIAKSSASLPRILAHFTEVNRFDRRGSIGIKKPEDCELMISHTFQVLSEK